MVLIEEVDFSGFALWKDKGRDHTAKTDIGEVRRWLHAEPEAFLQTNTDMT